MKFPMVSNIATTSVILIDVKMTVSKALDLMLEQNHRSAIVSDNDKFCVLTIMDILSIKNNGGSLNVKLYDMPLKQLPIVAKDQNVLETLDIFNSYDVEQICVVDGDGNFYGLVTHTDIMSSIDPDTLMENFRLSDYLKLSHRMKWVQKDVVTSELLQDMIDNCFDNAVVVENLKPIGILTTKDVMRIIKDNSDLSLSVEHFMSKPIETIHKNSSIKQALDFIQSKHYKRVVIVEDDGSLAGIITQKELISLTYSRWANLMKEYQEELFEINKILENKNKKYETLATTDPLTGLYNRFKFSELYLSTYKTMIQRENKASIIMLDIDHFKKINDTHGHNNGDKALIQVSHAILKTLRNVDIVCRWGGEEFVALIPTASLDIATKLAQKIREQIELLDIEVIGKITASFGVSQVKEGEMMEDAVDRADKALYLAKKSGRNCVKTELDLHSNH